MPAKNGIGGRGVVGVLTAGKFHQLEDSIGHSGSENFKKSRPKKLVKSNKSTSRIFFFYQIPFFAISKMAKNQLLN